MIDLLEITVLALGISYVGFDLYFLAAAVHWTRRLRQVNRNALMFSGFRDVLSFVYQGPVPGVAEDLAEPATTAERAGRLVTEAYPRVRDELGDTHQRVELPQRLQQLEKDARGILWISAALAAAVAALVVFAAATPYGVSIPYVFEVLISAVLGNSVLTMLFATTRAEMGISLQRSEEALVGAHASRAGSESSSAPRVPDQR